MATKGELLWKQFKESNTSQSAKQTNPGASAPGGQPARFATRGEREWAKFKAENGLIQSPQVQHTQSRYTQPQANYRVAARYAESAAAAAEKEYEEFLKSPEYTTMQDSKRIHQLLTDAGVGWASDYDPIQERELNAREKELRQKAEKMRGDANRYKEYDIWENADSLMQEAEEKLNAYLRTEEYAAWKITRDKRQAERNAMAQITGNPVVFPSGWDRNKREEELRAAVEYYRQIVTSKKEQAMMAEDLKEMESWSKADQDALKVYALGDYQNTMGSPEAAAAFGTMNPAAELFRKYGEQRVKEIAESYMRSQSEEAKQMAAMAAQEGAGSGFWAGVGHSAASLGVLFTY